MSFRTKSCRKSTAWRVITSYSIHYTKLYELVGAAIELNADAMLASVIISHDDIHYKNIARIDRIAREMGVREKLLFAAGGTQVDHDRAKESGADAGFGRGTHGNHVATS